MNRKNILIFTAVAVLLFALIVVAVKLLYSNVPADDGAERTSYATLLRAVPSDAAVVMCFSDVAKATDFIVDPSSPFSEFYSRTRSRRFLSFLNETAEKEIRGAHVVISMHFSGNMEPLMIVDGGRHSANDTSGVLKALSALCADNGLKHRLVQKDRDLLLVSASETLIGSSVRNIDEGSSILDDQKFISVLSRTSAPNVIYVNHEYASQLIATYLGRDYRHWADFVKKAVDWTALGIVLSEDSKLEMKGGQSFSKNASYYANVISAMTPGQTRLPEILPAGTVYSVAITDPDYKHYAPAFEKYIDAQGKLQERKKKLSSLSSDSDGPLQWRRDSNPSEVARVRWMSGKRTYEALFVRVQSKAKGEPKVVANDCISYLSVLYGDIFSIQDESRRVSVGNWTAIGSEEALYDWLETGRLNPIFPSSECSASLVMGNTVMTWSGNDCHLKFEIPDLPEDEVSSDTPAGLEISKGPFKVKNCGSGKINEFYQNEKNALCLRDESGKGLWGVPFGKDICGAVAEIDYLRNGKIQFLFCSGSEMYLIDRLGRFVRDFPVNLGKEVLLGPAAYEVPETRLMVLHTDNTVAMYDLKGKKPAEWTDIVSPYPILSLPVLVTCEGTRYWVVETRGGRLAYEFNGGDALKGKAARNVLK